MGDDHVSALYHVTSVMLVDGIPPMQFYERNDNQWLSIEQPTGRLDLHGTPKDIRQFAEAILEAVKADHPSE